MKSFSNIKIWSVNDAIRLVFPTVLDNMLLDNLIKILSLHIIEKADVKWVQQQGSGRSQIGFQWGLPSEEQLQVAFGKA